MQHFSMTLVKQTSVITLANSRGDSIRRLLTVKHPKADVPSVDLAQSVPFSAYKPHHMTRLTKKYDVVTGHHS